MLVMKILKKNFLRQKSITIVVSALIMLSAVLAAGGANLIVELSNSLNSLFALSDAPHFVQMHSGKIDQKEIDRWSAANRLVKKQQTVEMITIDGSSLFLGESKTSEENSIMDISFVTQNSSFDFLLDSDYRIARVNPGEIAVPVYYMQQAKMKIGDKVKILSKSYNKSFIVADFIRDAQMNPSIVHSKRFLINETDYASLDLFEREYLVEFLLSDPGKVKEFSDAYQSSGLPAKGPSVDYNLFKVLNALTDGIASGAVIVLSLLLIIIAVLCLRFTILTAMEEDYREIGVMKALGISCFSIKNIYMFRYMVTGGLASMIGYFLSLFFSRLFSAGVPMYRSGGEKSLVQNLIPVAAAGVIFVIVLSSCLVLLRRFNRITAAEALRSGSKVQSRGSGKTISLKKSMFPDVNIFLGFRDVIQRARMFILLCFVFFFCSGVIIIPVNFLSTIKSPDFISYMGIGKSDVRIDLRQSDNMDERFHSMVALISKDRDVERFSPLVTSRFKMTGSDGGEESISIESGDFSLFPLDYLDGGEPVSKNEIAISVLNSREMDKGIGDKLLLLVNGQQKEMVISGVYQDVTNGGRTAKALLPYSRESVLWYSVSLDLNSDVSIADKVHEYSAKFHPARITDLEGYLAQTLGGTIEQVGRVAAVSAAVGIVVSILITSLFMKMLIAGDSSQIAIMKSLGFSLNNIRLQYISKTLFLLAAGIIIGTVFSNTMGQKMVSLMWSFMGASEIRFVINPVQAYVVLPFLLMTAVSLTALVSLVGIRETSIVEVVSE